jgi:hypothetical protein
MTQVANVFTHRVVYLTTDAMPLHLPAGAHQDTVVRKQVSGSIPMSVKRVIVVSAEARPPALPELASRIASVESKL